MKKSSIILLLALLNIMIGGLYQIAFAGFDNDIDIEVFYYLDDSTDFLEMKMGVGNIIEENGHTYWQYDYGLYKIRYWVGEDSFTIVGASVIRADYDEYEFGDPETIRLMGIGFDMTLEEAAENVKATPSWDRGNTDIQLKYYDHDGDNKVDQIDVISNKTLQMTVNSEDFYLKFLGQNILEEWQYLDNYSANLVDKNETNRTYTYKVTMGPDVWEKIYGYSESNIIISMQLKGKPGLTYKANIPSLMGIALNMTIEEARNALADNNNILDKKTYTAKNPFFMFDEYEIQRNAEEENFVVKVMYGKSSQKVASVEVAKMAYKSYDQALDLIGKTKKDVIATYGDTVFQDYTQGNSEMEPYMVYTFNNHDLYFIFDYAGEKVEEITLRQNAANGKYDQVSFLGIQLGMTRSEAEEFLTNKTKQTELSEGETYYTYYQYTLDKYLVIVNEAYDYNKNQQTNQINHINARLAPVKNVSLDMSVDEIIAVLGDDYELEQGYKEEMGGNFAILRYEGFGLIRQEGLMDYIEISSSRYGIFEDVKVGDLAKEAIIALQAKYENKPISIGGGMEMTFANLFDRGDGTYLIIDTGEDLIMDVNQIEPDTQIKGLVLTNRLDF